VIQWLIFFQMISNLDCNFYDQVSKLASKTCLNNVQNIQTNSITECVLHCGLNQCMESVRDQNGRCYCTNEEHCISNEEEDSELVSWIKAPFELLTNEPICYSGRDNDFASFIISREGRVKAFKLVHVSGAIYCSSPAINKKPSTWGCNHWAFPENHFLTIISNANNKIIIQKTHDSTQDKYGKEFLLTANEPMDFRKNEELRVWYGEDFHNTTEHDNTGRQCIRVYARFC
uniref:SET domain-containing protein n=1 Tax=Clytia hemisphaerica TaxID=252671 RepID=A0A7M5XK66_9CNID